MKSRSLKAALAFLTAASAVVGFAGASSAANVEGQTYSFPLQAKSDADITGNASATVNGANVDYTIFADNVDVDAVVMHWHAGDNCDAAGGVEIGIPGETTVVRNPAETVKNGFVITGSAPLGTADMENVYFNVHEAGNLANVIACGELDASDSPLLIDGSGNNRSTAFSATNANTLNGTDVVLTGGVTLEGNKLAVNLQLTGDDLLDGNNRVVTLRNNSSCDASTDTYLTSDIIRSLTGQGTTAPPSASNDLLTVFNNSAWSKTIGAPPAPSTAQVNTTIILTPEEVDAYGDMTIVVHGNESNSDMTVLPAPLNLMVRQAQPVACGQLGVGDATAPINGNYYALEFEEVGSSGYSGTGTLKNTTASDAGSVEAHVLINAPAAAAGVHKVVLDNDTSCDALTAPIGWASIAPDLLANGTDQIDINTGVLRSIFGPLENTGAFSGADATTVNDGQFTVLIANESKDTVLACAQLSRTFGEAPEAPPAPSDVPPFDGTVAEATTLEEILMASDYRANATNTGTDQEIMRLYQAFFGRDPDVAGVQYWISVSKGEVNGTVYSTLELAGFFPGASDEFANQFEGISNQAFVDAVYQNVLGREGEAAGVAYWNDILDGTNNSGNNPALSQGTRADVVYYVAINQEFINREPYAVPAG